MLRSSVGRVQAAAAQLLASTPAPAAAPRLPTRSFAQGAAAAQAGVSVVQPNVGRLHDWYNRHPGVIRDPNVSRRPPALLPRSPASCCLAQPQAVAPPTSRCTGQRLCARRAPGLALP